jgi:hypothetical protein
MVESSRVAALCGEGSVGGSTAGLDGGNRTGAYIVENQLRNIDWDSVGQFSFA